MLILYNKVRDLDQWTLDCIDNDINHYKKMLLFLVFAVTYKDVVKIRINFYLQSN